MLGTEIAMFTDMVKENDVVIVVVSQIKLFIFKTMKTEKTVIVISVFINIS